VKRQPQDIARSLCSMPCAGDPFGGSRYRGQVVWRHDKQTSFRCQVFCWSSIESCIHWRIPLSRIRTCGAIASVSSSTSPGLRPGEPSGSVVRSLGMQPSMAPGLVRLLAGIEPCWAYEQGHRAVEEYCP